MHRNIAPEQQLTIQWFQVCDDPLHKPQIHRPQALRVYLWLRLSLAQFHRLIRPQVEKRPGIDPCQFREHIVRQLLRVSLRRSKHMPMRRLRQRCVLLPVQQVMQMPERLLLWNDRHMVLGCIRHQLASLVLRERPPRRRH